jgi:dolichol-phosphate mannosyltransferase
MKISVILPTYNESGHIVELVEQVREQLSRLKPRKGYEVLVIDDDSPDGTAELVKTVFENVDCTRVVERKERGFATAVMRGLREATGDILVVMDADFNHNPKDIPLLVRCLRDFDVVVGSRFVPGGGMESKSRYALTFGLNALTGAVLGTPLLDRSSGFFSIGKRNLQRLEFEKIFYGYGDYFLRLLYYAERMNLKVLEIPTFYPQRASGKSKTQLVPVMCRFLVSMFRLKAEELKEWRWRLK